MQERIITYFIMNHLNGWASCGIDLQVAGSKQEEFGRVDALPPLQREKWKPSTQDL